MSEPASASQPNKRVKSYKTYLLESKQTNQSIIQKYGMPPTAHAPSPLERSEQIIQYNSDSQFRQTLARTLYMKKGTSFNADQPT